MTTRELIEVINALPASEPFLGHALRAMADLGNNLLTAEARIAELEEELKRLKKRANAKITC